MTADVRYTLRAGGLAILARMAKKQRQALRGAAPDSATKPEPRTLKTYRGLIQKLLASVGRSPSEVFD